MPLPPVGPAGRPVRPATEPAAGAPPVLLVHGFASSFERNWREPGWVDLLGDAGRQVIAMDLPGHGGAAKPHDPEAYGGLEAALHEALPGEGQVDAVGFSLGGHLLLRAAAARPERFRRIVVGGVGDGIFAVADPRHGEELAVAVERGSAPEGASGAAQAFARFADAPGNDREALAACLRRRDTPLRAEDLAVLRCPVLVVIGDRDFAGPADALVGALGGARLVTLPGADHFGTPKDFRFVEAALEFLGASPL